MTKTLKTPLISGEIGGVLVILDYLLSDNRVLYSHHSKRGKAMGVSLRRLNIEYALVHSFYWMGYCVCVSFATVFLQGRGYSNFSLGLVVAAGNIAGFLLSPWLASMVDKGRGVSVYGCLWLLLFAQLLFIASFLFIPGRGPLLSALYCLYIACNSAVNPMNTQLCFELDGWTGRINYGAARGVGSFAYAPMSVLLGSLTNRLGSDILPAVGIACLLLQCVMLALLTLRRGKGASAQRPDYGEAGSASGTLAFLRANPRFCHLLLGSALLFFTHNIIISYMINIVRSVGGDNVDLGRINGLMALLELPVMLLYSAAARKLPCSSLLRFSVLMFTAKALCVTFAPSVGWLYAAQLLQGCSYAIYTPAMVQYTGLVVGPRDSAKAQALAFGMTTLGCAFAGALGGLMYDNMTVRATLLASIAVSALGALLCAASVEKTNNR